MYKASSVSNLDGQDRVEVSGEMHKDSSKYTLKEHQVSKLLEMESRRIKMVTCGLQVELTM